MKTISIETMTTRAVTVRTTGEDARMIARDFTKGRLFEMTRRRPDVDPDGPLPAGCRPHYEAGESQVVDLLACAPIIDCHLVGGGTEEDSTVIVTISESWEAEPEGEIDLHALPAEDGAE